MSDRSKQPGDRRCDRTRLSAHPKHRRWNPERTPREANNREMAAVLADLNSAQIHILTAVAVALADGKRADLEALEQLHPIGSQEWTAGVMALGGIG